MARLIQFLLRLAGERFYGQVLIRFRDGRLHGQIEVHQEYLESTLPQPDVTAPGYQQLIAEVVAGVEYPTDSLRSALSAREPRLVRGRESPRGF